MTEIRDCIAPDRNPRRPRTRLPKGSVDTHVHVFEPGYALSPARGYTPPDSTLACRSALRPASKSGAESGNLRNCF